MRKGPQLSLPIEIEDVKPEGDSKPDEVKHFSLDKAIDELAGVFTDPIIVHQCGWATKDMIPEWLRQRITTDRLIEQMVAKKEGRDQVGTDSEALAYLIPASLEAPMDHDWSQIYLYLATRVMDGETNKTVPEDIRVDQLDRNQMDDLNRLKRWIHQTKAKHRKVKAREIKKERKEEEAREKESVAKEKDAIGVQLSIFDF